MRKRILSIVTLMCFLLSFTIVIAETDDAEPDTTTVSLAVSSNNISIGESVTLTATVSPATSDGIVTFMDGEAELGTGSVDNGEASFIAENLALGDHTIKAVYSDGGNPPVEIESDTITVTVDKTETQTVLTSSEKVAEASKSVVFTATVKAGETLVDEGTVTFKYGSKTIDKDINEGTAKITVDNLALGNYVVTAEYSGSDTYKSSTSNTVDQKIYNSYISSLKVNGEKLKVKDSTDEYSVTVGSSEDYAEIIVTTKDSNATIEIDGVEVKSGKLYNKIYLKKGVKTSIDIVISSYGVEKNYTLYVTRKKSSSSSGGVSVKYRYQPSTGITYGDIAGSWAAEAITGLTSKGIFTGEKVGDYYCFYPERKLTRTEFAVVVVRMMQADIDLSRYIELPFNDAAQIPEWGLAEVRSAYFNNWMGGDGSNFHPEEYISRAEALTVLARVKGYNGSNAYFNDSGDIPHWAFGAICGLTEAGIINGYSDNTIRPNETITRAEAATIIYNMQNR